MHLAAALGDATGAQPDADLAQLTGLPEVEGVAWGEGLWEISLTRTSDPARAMEAIVGAVPTSRIELRRPTLEDVFISLTGRELRE